MTRNPIYDYPEPYANPRQGVPPSPQNISLVGRLRLTQPVWLQLGINAATALHILQREPPGTFLVRRSNTRQCQVLCLRLPDNSSPAFVTTYRLRQERTAIALEGSDLDFPSLLHLIASYCTSPDILPISLHLPQPIREASSCQQLEAIAHLGLEFWSSSLNAKALARPDLPVPPSSTDLDSPLDPPSEFQVQNCAGPVHEKPATAYDLPCPPSEASPLVDGTVRRQQFKNNLKVQVSTEAASPLSPPAAPPPPIPTGKKKNPPQLPRPSDPSGRSHPSGYGSLPQIPGATTEKASTTVDIYCTPQSRKEKPFDPCGQHSVSGPSPGQLLHVMEEERLEE